MQIYIYLNVSAVKQVRVLPKGEGERKAGHILI